MHHQPRYIRDISHTTNQGTLEISQYLSHTCITNQGILEISHMSLIRMSCRHLTHPSYPSHACLTRLAPISHTPHTSHTPLIPLTHPSYLSHTPHTSHTPLIPLTRMSPTHLTHRHTPRTPRLVSTKTFLQKN